MGILAVEGKFPKLKFYNSGLIDNLIQELDQNKKDLLQFAEKLRICCK